MIQLENITFSFKKRSHLFNNLNLTLESGSTYGLFGMNGAGKSTLLNIITGMLFPSKGACFLKGEQTSKRLPSTLSNLFIVPEQFDLPALSPQEFISIHKPFYPRFDSSELNSLMERFKLDTDSLLTKQSYGQRKKFLISFALATNTELLVMDEPTNGLDIPSKSQFRKVMAQSNSENRCTIISTHQVRDLETMIDHITVLHSGKIIFNQSVEEISNRLVFKKSDGISPESLYAEEILGGFHTILNRSGTETSLPLDLELFFSAVIEKTDTINHAFSRS